MRRAIVPYIRNLAAATTSPRALRPHARASLEAPGATAGWDGWPGEGLL